MRTLLFFSWVILAASITFGAEEDDDTPHLKTEARKRQFSSLQKELETARPESDVTEEQVMAYLELVKDGYGKFARENPRTAEGFEAASIAATMLSQARHPDALTFAELAVKNAPEAGIDKGRVALCWAMIADGRLQRQDMKGAQEAVKQIEPLNKEMYDQLSAQLDEANRHIAALAEAANKLQPGKEPYDIEATDTGGNRISLAALKGKVVVIDFWAPWCGPCMEEMPSLSKLYQKLHASGLEIVGISLDRNEEELAAAAEQHGIKWPIVSDHNAWNNPIARKWGVRSIPATYVIDRRGIIRHVNLRGEKLSEAVEQLFNLKP
jgi:peroxiredoxin